MMKIIIQYSFLIALIVGAVSCENDTTKDTSIITTFPVITVLGDNPVMINKGDAFTDPGAEAFIGDDQKEVTVTGSADPTTAGIYKISYGVVNGEGFAAAADRIVVVMDTDPSTINLEGLWARGNGRPNNITQISDRKYVADNMGGAFAPGDPDNMVVQFYNVDDSRLFIPFQENVSPSGLSVSGLDSGFCPDCLITGPDNIQWALNASGAYGTFVRTFSRQ